MKRLLEIVYPSFHNLNREIVVHEHTYVSDFALTDWKSGTDCNNKTPYFYNQCYNKEVLKVSTSEEVKVISIEEYFQQYSNKKDIVCGNICDYLLYGCNKIIFADLTCMRPYHIESHIVNGKNKEGKRAKVIKQINDSIERLVMCPTISERMNLYKEKIALFALRKKESAFDYLEDSQRGMISFMRMTNEQIVLGITQQMRNGFNLVINEYPKPYQW